MPKATQKRTKAKVKTPLGVFAWPYLDRPDKKFATKDKPDGTYKVDVIVESSDPQLDALRRQLDELVEAHLQEEHLSPHTEIHFPIMAHLDENKEPTGKTLLRCSEEASYYPDDGPPVPRTLTFLDARGNPTGSVRAGGGTRGVVFCVATANYVKKDDMLYVKLRPEGVQIVDLVRFGGFNKGAYGGVEDLSGEGSFVPDEDDNDAPEAAGDGVGAPGYGKF